MLKEKSVAHRCFKNNINDENYLKFSELRKLCKSKSNKDYLEYIDKTEQSITCDTKSFWKYTNYLRGTRGLPSQMCFGDTKVDTGQDIVNLFADYFESVYTPESTTTNSINDSVSSNINIGQMGITQQEVYTAVVKLKTNTGPGPDGIPPSFLVN